MIHGGFQSKSLSNPRGDELIVGFYSLGSFLRFHKSSYTLSLVTLGNLKISRLWQTSPGEQYLGLFKHIICVFFFGGENISTPSNGFTRASIEKGKQV